ncbi:MAG: OmpW family protein [Rhodospirillaceae bacterium]|nr:OmpW family protein [Rhodospirillaceae bacterium]
MSFRKTALFAALFCAASMSAASMYAAVSAAEPQGNAGRFLVRLRAIGVVPDERSTVSAIGGAIKASSTVVPELDFSYFFTDTVAVELIAAVTKHTLDDVGSAVGTAPLGSTWLLPPTVTVQYHFLSDDKFDPYIGAGLNYTTTFSVRKPSTGPVTAVRYGDSFGPALQAGVDYRLDDRWSLNLDLQKVWLKSDVSINNGAIAAKVHLDPWIIGTGVGYRF